MIATYMIDSLYHDDCHFFAYYAISFYASFLSKLVTLLKSNMRRLGILAITLIL